MKLRLSLAATLLASISVPALADAGNLPSGPITTRVESTLPDNATNLSRAAFAAISGERWDEAARLVEAMPKGQLKYIATAELYLAANSPRVELGPLLTLLQDAPEIPQAAQLARLAEKRGAQMLPTLPQRKHLSYVPGPEHRRKPDSVSYDSQANAIRSQIIDFIKNDDPSGAQALLDNRIDALSADGRTEMEQRIAWSYYIENQDRSALAMARRAQSGSGSWVVHADWVAGLAAWRLKDCSSAATSFDRVAQRSGSEEMRAAGYYWATRAYTMCGRPDEVQQRMQMAARYDGTLYGLIAAEALGMQTQEASFDMTGNSGIEHQPGIATVIQLADIGEIGLADEMLKHQAQIGPDADHGQLLKLARGLGLPRTQLYLAHNTPRGFTPQPIDRFPVANWQPDRGWRVDPALVFAHALQESRFQDHVVSPAGAQGLMQVMPGTARVIARNKGLPDGANLFRASTNLEYGQSYLEMLRDMGATGGLLPKIAAAYNAGPAPVERWNTEINDGGDPLLYVESIPYYETREYVGVILRNYWMYGRALGSESPTLTEIAQYHWPRFPKADPATVRRFTQR